MEVKNLSFQVKGRQLLHNISFQLRPGSFFGIVGANGAGKSTLLKLLSRELSPSSGSIAFQGKSLRLYKSSELAQQRAVLSQHNRVELDFTVQDIVMMGRYPYYQCLPSSHDHHVVALCMQQVGIDHFYDRQYPTLSGGEQQRVQLARALAQIWNKKNAFLLLDEPTTGMDLLHQHQTFQLASTLCREGFGVVAVVHDLNLASQYTDQLLLLKSGQQYACGPTLQTLTKTNIQAVFGLPVRVIQSADICYPYIVPYLQSGNF